MKQKEEQHHQIEKLKQDWKQLDELAGDPSLSAIEMKQQLEVYQEKQKKRFYKELLMFFATAVLILSCFIISLVQAPILFLVVEIGAMILGPIVYFALVKRKNKEGKVLL
ncbi:YxlC family protein [Mesobacillus maritimus]|uniref:YxlC family protein n=1 Tax=Mesobacillus maritimus TaxID=1643336 RepID=UPI00203BF339|nr:YxlC family protein [Mesobacillus maritimus]